METLILHHHYIYIDSRFFLALWLIVTALYCISLIWEWYKEYTAPNHVLDWEEVFFPSRYFTVFVLHYVMMGVTITIILINVSKYLMQYL